jgi:hypothetical protein
MYSRGTQVIRHPGYNEKTHQHQESRTQKSVEKPLNPFRQVDYIEKYFPVTIVVTGVNQVEGRQPAFLGSRSGHFYEKDNNDTITRRYTSRNSTSSHMNSR